jgi:hypothetical protein
MASLICRKRGSYETDEQENMVVLGYYHRKNYGDDILLKVAQGIYRRARFYSTEELSMTEDCARDIMSWADRVILFGGEVLNSYFLDKLVFFKTYALDVLRKNVLFYAVGVSQNEENIVNKLAIFEHIIFRTKKTSVAGRSLPDPTFLLPLRPLPGSGKRNGSRVAYFLSQTANTGAEYVASIVNGMQFWISRGAHIHLFTMCNRDGASGEDDRIINQAVMRALNGAATVINDPAAIFSYMPSMDYAVCYRFHAHIFCIRYGVPFVSISTTPKVMNLLEDNDLQSLCLSDMPRLIARAPEIRARLLAVNKANERAARGYHENLPPQRIAPSFYIRPDDPRIYEFLMRGSEKTAHSILASMTGRYKTDYEWGLAQKLRTGQDLRADISWLISEETKRGNPSFYARMAQISGIADIIYPRPCAGAVNINYIDQNDMQGCHRSGWQYVIDNMRNVSLHPAAPLLDMYLDRTFHWNLDINKNIGILPYRKPWLGFIHHTCNPELSPYNTTAMFRCPEFLASLAQCRGLYVLSKYLQRGVMNLLMENGYPNIPVRALVHPTEPCSRKFILNQNDMRVTQVGAWYRDISAIFRLSLGSNVLNFRKYALVGPNMDGYYSADVSTSPQISRDMERRDHISHDGTQVTLLKKLSNEEYDDLFSKSLIFICLQDASAVNTIIEAIMRDTPILVNRLEAVVEYLGPKYPLYYETLEEASALLNNISAIRAAQRYLRKMDKRPFQIETFLKSI